MRHDMHLGAGDPGAVERLIAGEANAREQALAEAWRRHGHRAARIDPLDLAPRDRDPSLDADDAPWLAPLAQALEAAYGGPLAWDFAHVADPARRAWLAERAEAAWIPSAEHRARAARLIAETEAFEAATLKRLPTAKTFSLDGAEGFMVLADAVIAGASADEVVVGGMHRGRLAQMALLFGKPMGRLVAELKGAPDLPRGLGAASDVPYHLGWAGRRPDGRRVWVAPHPSHLSIVGPVAVGRARALGPRALPLVLHTDAAFAGQGVNLELLQLSGLGPYAVGGVIHLILDNRIGFTTDAEAARTSRTPADAARAVEAPILHVNGEDPDAALRAAETALAWRARWGSDIVVVLTAYRRRGHNEVDDPRFTQPAMQAAIEARPKLSDLYAPLGGRPDLAEFQAELDAAFRAAPTTPNDVLAAPGLAEDAEARMLAAPDTAIAPDRAAALLDRLGTPPAALDLHPKAAQVLARRRAMAAGDAPVDWAAAEALAFASLLSEGTPVRFSGQDAVRGAFSQRHLVLADQTDGRRVGVLSGFGARAEVFDTPLIENAVVGFEYGLSLGDPTRLIVWEAQFGDFLNVFQPMFDQFVSGGEDRWLLTSNLTLLLPHGWDGGGPDHSTGHVERVLARCARANLHVVNASTPAQWFHLLRGQAKAELRKPMVAFTPKALLRHAGCASPLADFAGRFAPVLGRASHKAERVVIASGKLAVLLEAARDAAGFGDRVAIVRLERLHPFPAEALAAALDAAPDAALVFAQEEPENLGPWLWLDRRIERAAGRAARLVSRPAAASPAVGWRSWHDDEERAVIDAALHGDAP
ncbi:MAG: thiamine pyrophosphate-dependent enzyme [Pseudomonadota bacterium]